ncbi:MAG: hypothetical protein IPJ54_10250 [Saprospiraceae bacterium]|nr:hypothetical protein [Saprospiraceae bacterium]
MNSIISKNGPYFSRYLILFPDFLWLPFVMVGQSFDTEFGKNRVQYNDDFKYWSQYESPNFIVYWYGKGKNIAHTIIQMAELDHDIIRKQVEHRISDKIEILVYVDLSDFKQSNIGGEEVFQSESGETKIVGSKMLVYFDGSHVNLREKIREGIASVYLSSMLFGSNFQEVVQNAVLLDLPTWYKPGFVSYAAMPGILPLKMSFAIYWRVSLSSMILKNFLKNTPELPAIRCGTT